MKFLFNFIVLFTIISAGCESQSNETFYDNYFSEKDFNGQVLISKDGQIIYHKVFGYSDVEKQIDTKIDDTYLIGSITKQFTSISILILEEQGLLSTKDN
jgi:CubicO group peptidase (beta-lactamase class C family)